MDVAGHALLRCGSCSSLWVADPPAAGATEALYREESYYTADTTGEAAGDAIPPGYTGHYMLDRRNVEVQVLVPIWDAPAYFPRLRARFADLAVRPLQRLV